MRHTIPALCLLLVAACQPKGGDGPFPVERLGSLRYDGTESGPVTLVEGVWQGDPFVEGGAERPEVDLAGSDPALGDLDGDGSDDAVVVLTEQLGGSGIFVYLAVVTRRGDTLENAATVLLGDRVGVSSVRIAERELIAEIVTATDDDPLCCPTLRQRVRWRLDGSELVELGRETLGRISREASSPG